LSAQQKTKPAKEEEKKKLELVFSPLLSSPSPPGA